MALGAGGTPQMRLPRLALSGQPQVLVQLRVEDLGVHYEVSSQGLAFNTELVLLYALEG